MAGPVMQPGEVAASYDKIAARWTAPQFNHENGISAHRRALNFVQSGGRALDVGCGSNGRFIDLLLKTGFEVEGLDLSDEMIRLARARHPDVRFHHADIRLWQTQTRYNFISAWDSIWHVPLLDQPDVLTKICGLLDSGGVFVFTAGGLDVPSEVRDETMGVPMYHATPGIPAILKTLGASGCLVRHLEYDQYPAPHVYLIVQRVGGRD